jgi:hypothetical protein
MKIFSILSTKSIKRDNNNIGDPKVVDTLKTQSVLGSHEKKLRLQ